MSQYWQIAAGNANRDYSSLFLKHGIAFVGGDEQVAQAQKIQVGDIIILKSGFSLILAVGEVVERKGRHSGTEDKLWVRDIEGWDLKAYVYVDWRAPRKPETTTGLTRNSISLSHKSQHSVIADRLMELPKIAAKPEPAVPVFLTKAEATAIIMEANDALDKSSVEGVFDLATQWMTNSADAAEWDANQTKNTILLPFLKGFGWASNELHEKMAGLGTRNLIGLLPMGSKSRQDLKLIECRPFNFGTDLHPKRASELSKQFPDVQSIAVSNGLTFKLYARQANGIFGTEPRAYGNLAKPTDPCPFDNDVLGVKAVLRWLTRRAS